MFKCVKKTCIYHKKRFRSRISCHEVKLSCYGIVWVNGIKAETEGMVHTNGVHSSRVYIHLCGAVNNEMYFIDKPTTVD